MAFDRVGQQAGRRGDAAKPAQQVQRRSLGGEHRPRRAADARHGLAALDARASAYWGGAEASQPVWPAGVEPIEPHVTAPPALGPRFMSASCQPNAHVEATRATNAATQWWRRSAT